MSKPKHTPGPWVILGESTLNIQSKATPKGRRVCSLLATHLEDTANAQLIAAAPELLSVLQDYIDDQNGEKLLDGTELWKRMNTAIRKAKGGAE